jgi:hypothetical protein
MQEEWLIYRAVGPQGVNDITAADLLCRYIDGDIEVAHQWFVVFPTALVAEEIRVARIQKDAEVKIDASAQLPPPAIPQLDGVVSMRQARLALAQAGHLATIDAIVASLPDAEKEVFEIEWEYATTVEKDSAWVQQMAAALGLDDAGLDALFDLAATL